MELSDDELQAMLDQAAQRAVEAFKKSRRKPRTDSLTEEQQALVVQIHADWQQAWQCPTWTLTEQRRKIIGARVREGRTREEFAKINAALSKNPFYWGQNDRNKPYFDVFNLFGSVEKFDRNLRRAEGGGGDLQPPREAGGKGRRF